MRRDSPVDEAAAIPPPWTLWILRALLPASQRDAIVASVLERFRETARASGRGHARRWLRGEVREYGWPAVRLPALFVLLSFLAGDGLRVSWPGDAGVARWLQSSWPAVGLLAAGAALGWRGRTGWAGAVAGFVASALVTAGVQVAYVVGLAIGQPQLFKIGLTWATLRDLLHLWTAATLAGTLLAGVGGLAGHAVRGLVRRP